VLGLKLEQHMIPDGHSLQIPIHELGRPEGE
jgi:hypothetical protein